MTIKKLAFPAAGVLAAACRCALVGLRGGDDAGSSIEGQVQNFVVGDRPGPDANGEAMSGKVSLA